jgi:cyclophilin family peptidyl-prolyl cis-trans isomerase
MDWIKRSLRAFAPAVSQSRPRRRLEFESLEDRAVPTAAGAINGTVIFDNNGDQIRNGSDFNVPGATIVLTGTTDLGNAVNLTTTTTSNGTFNFLKLEPGIYQVSASVPSGPNAVAGLGNLGGTAAGNQVQTIVIQQGQTEANLLFSFVGGDTGGTLDSSLISLRLFLNTNIGDPATGTPNKLVTESVNSKANDFRTKFVDDATPGTGRVLADGLIGQSIPAGTASLAGEVKDAANAGVAGVQIQLSGVNKTGVPILLTTNTDATGEYSFANLTPADYFINLIPGAGFRATGATVGSLGGSATRADQIATSTLVDAATGTGYNFSLVAFSSDLDAGLANDVGDDVGNGSLGTSSDGTTSDPSIRGRLVNAASFTTVQARFTGGSFVSIKDSIAADGSFVLNAQTVRDIFGGGLPDGTYTFEIVATPASGAALSKSVNFTLKTTGPSFLHGYGNLTNAASAANTVMLLAGGFTDPNISNSTVTLKALKGTTPVDINLELFDKEAPRTVANFFNYFDRYALSGGVLFHRLHLESGLRVLQGGGFNFNEVTNTLNTAHITEDPQIVNEFSQDRPNSRGTIAMAKTSDPNSATSEFFFNLDDANATTLNINNGPGNTGGSGGFTVFGRLQSDADLAVVDDLSSVPIKNTGQFNELPLVDGNTVDVNNLERIKQVVTVNRDNELTYTVNSSNPAAVTATVGGFQGNQLTLDYLAAGTSTITVTATDKTGNTATQTFIVTVT